MGALGRLARHVREEPEEEVAGTAPHAAGLRQASPAAGHEVTALRQRVSSPRRRGDSESQPDQASLLLAPSPGVEASARPASPGQGTGVSLTSIKPRCRTDAVLRPLPAVVVPLLARRRVVRVLRQMEAAPNELEVVPRDRSRDPLTGSLSSLLTGELRKATDPHSARHSCPACSPPSPFCSPSRASGRRGAAEDHHAEGALRLQHGRRLLPGQLQAARRLLAEARRRVRPAQGRQHRQRPRRAGRSSWRIVTSPANHKKLDRYQDIARRLARAEGVTADEAAQARRRRQGRRLDRRRAARQRGRSAPRCSIETHLPARHRAPTPRRCRILDDVDHPVRPRQPRRARPRRRLVHARARTRRSGRSPACRGSTRSTSATTTTATSTPTPRPRRGT